MTISKSHYHRNRLLRDRIRRGDSQLRRNTPASSTQAASDVDDDFTLPEYFRDAADASDDAPTPIVILWDEVA